MEMDMRRFLAKAKNALRPLSLNGEATFVNFSDRDFPTKSHERAYFGDNREKLRQVKEMWDNDNFFKWAQGVRLPGDPEEDAEDEDEESKTDKLAGEQWETYVQSGSWKHYVPTGILADLNALADLGYGKD